MGASLCIYTLADAGRLPQALSLLTALRDGWAESRRPPVLGLIGLDLDPAARQQVEAAGILVGEGRIEAATAWPSEVDGRLYQKYRGASLFEAERFLYVDADVVFTRTGRDEWIERALWNQGFLGVRQPVTWFHLLRSHGISSDAGLRDFLYDPIVCASMFAATAAALKDLDAAAVAEAAVARRQGWAWWGHEAALNRILHGEFWLHHRIFILNATWHWPAGLGLSVLSDRAIERRDLADEVRGAPLGLPCTPSGDPVRVVHFGAGGPAERVADLDPARILPYPYRTRNGQCIPRPS